MSDIRKLRLKYTKLKRAGKDKEAVAVLKQIWESAPKPPKPQPAVKMTVRVEPKEVVSPEDKLLDNYLAQNAKTVIKSLKEDELDILTLMKLRKIEDKTKKRKSVLKTIDSLVKNLTQK